MRHSLTLSLSLCHLGAYLFSYIFRFIVYVARQIAVLINTTDESKAVRGAFSHTTWCAFAVCLSAVRAVQSTRCATLRGGFRVVCTRSWPAKGLSVDHRGRRHASVVPFWSRSLTELRRRRAAWASLRMTSRRPTGAAGGERAACVSSVPAPTFMYLLSHLLCFSCRLVLHCAIAEPHLCVRQGTKQTNIRCEECDQAKNLLLCKSCWPIWHSVASVVAERELRKRAARDTSEVIGNALPSAPPLHR